MLIGKRRQKRRCTSTAVGSIRPRDGLRPDQVDEALRLARPPELPPRRRSAAERTPRSLPHVHGAVKMLIGCADRAGMGSIGAVAEAVRCIVRRAKRSELPLEATIPVAIDAAAESADRLTIEPHEAAAAAGLAARQVSSSEDARVRSTVDRRIIETVDHVPENADDADDVAA